MRTWKFPLKKNTQNGQIDNNVQIRIQLFCNFCKVRKKKNFSIRLYKFGDRFTLKSKSRSNFDQPAVGQYKTELLENHSKKTDMVQF